ncbi:MAG: iron chelate uptake ABC transporter family permease subunit [Paracoccus sp. (in: a-proteobacteria)]|uniref:iron chelate uptake ABC transporter family permease subunit n=1 Tax=Paracoccus sp. TaxID=267 RepID=UPI00391C7CAD
MAELTMHETAASARPDRRALWLLAGLALLLAGLSALWMWQGLGAGNRGFILGLRATKLAALVVVGVAVGVATVLFQTVAANRVLTPSIMGFDALYVLLQTGLIAGLGTSGFVGLPQGGKFLAEIAVMAVLACLLFGTLLLRGARDVPRMILTGVILGVLFRSVAGFLGRVMDPNEFAVVQAVSFASFNRVEAGLIPIAMAVTAAAVGLAWRMSARLDVLALGRDAAVSLGLRHQAVVLAVLALVAVLVSVSTALVGPVAFFGLIVAGLAHGLMRCAAHAVLLPAAGLIAACLLVGGQWLFERQLGQAATLSVVVEFAGGLFFLYLLLKGRIR